MAAAAPTPHNSELRSWFREEDHPIWYESFSDDEREHLLEEDLQAGYRVPILLASVICCGVLLAVVSVWLIW